MTLAEVAKRIRQNYRILSHPGLTSDEGFIVNSFESDPDFTLRERLEVTASNYEECVASGHPHEPCRTFARRLRELLEGK